MDEAEAGVALGDTAADASTVGSATVGVAGGEAPPFTASERPAAFWLGECAASATAAAAGNFSEDTVCPFPAEDDSSERTVLSATATGASAASAGGTLPSVADDPTVGDASSAAPAVDPVAADAAGTEESSLAGAAAAAGSGPLTAAVDDAAGGAAFSGMPLLAACASTAELSAVAESPAGPPVAVGGALAAEGASGVAAAGGEGGEAADAAVDVVGVASPVPVGAADTGVAAAVVGRGPSKEVRSTSDAGGCSAAEVVVEGGVTPAGSPSDDAAVIAEASAAGAVGTAPGFGSSTVSAARVLEADGSADGAPGAVTDPARVSVSCLVLTTGAAASAVGGVCWGSCRRAAGGAGACAAAVDRATAAGGRCRWWRR